MRAEVTSGLFDARSADRSSATDDVHPRDFSGGILLELNRKVPAFGEEHAVRLGVHFIPRFTIVGCVKTIAFRLNEYNRAALAYLVLASIGRDHVRRDLDRYSPRRSRFPHCRVEGNVAEPIEGRVIVAYARSHDLRSHGLEVSAVAEQHDADARLPVDDGVVLCAVTVPGVEK